MIGFLRDVFAQNAAAEALVWQDRPYDYRWLLERLDYWVARLGGDGVAEGSVVSIEADFSPDGVALFLALIERRCVLVPLASVNESQRSEFLGVASVELRCVAEAGAIRFLTTGSRAEHPHVQTLRSRGHPGLVLFSSGSTGRSKAAVHDLTFLLEKFRVRRRSQRAITFLLYDHIGGVNTMLHTLSNAGCMVAVAERSPDSVLAAVARHRVELLPTSPSFLNLVLLSQAWQRHDLSSLRTVTYGTEPMPESTLRRVHAILPGVALQQTYGLSELGILRSKSKASDSLWMKIGGEGYETRVVDGLLQIKARSAMLGYLNAPSPFTADGWYLTGDAVEVDGDQVRVLGRRSDLINVGGEKVYPSEVESVLLEHPSVADCRVLARPNPLLGHVVAADVVWREAGADALTVKRLLHAFAEGRLPRYKLPVAVRLVAQVGQTRNWKKSRTVVQP